MGESPSFGEFVGCQFLFGAADANGVNGAFGFERSPFHQGVEGRAAVGFIDFGSRDLVVWERAPSRPATGSGAQMAMTAQAASGSIATRGSGTRPSTASGHVLLRSGTHGLACS